MIGAGHAGLAMSRCLAERGLEHVVLERGEVGNAWKTERWDSLRLLTPNWQSRLPGYDYDGDDPDGYRTLSEIIAFVEGYAAVSGAPVETRTTVRSLSADDGGFLVTTDRGDWRCRTVVIATGACARPLVPAFAEDLPAEVATVPATAYRNPEQLEAGGVLVVGASSSGTQIAEEIQHSGRPVTLAVGEHIRLPRSYRGRDIYWWMDRIGLLDERYDEIDDLERARRLPSLQLTGSSEGRTLDLNALTGIGVKLVGRLAGIVEGKAQFSGSLPNLCTLSDLKMIRLLDSIDAWIEQEGLDGKAEAAERLPATEVPRAPRLGLDLTSGEIRTIVWATGYRPDYGWLEIPVLDRKGRLRHDGGVVDWPGLYVLGLQFLRRRKSALIDGTGDDARALGDHLAAYLDGSAPPTGLKS